MAGMVGEGAVVVNSAARGDAAPRCRAALRGRVAGQRPTAAAIDRACGGPYKALVTETGRETDLVERAAAGDLDAFTALVDSRRERVFWIAYQIVSDAELARDVTQEVFLRLYRVIGRFRSGGRFDPWLHRITLHLAIDALRKERPHRQTVPLDDPVEGPSTGRPGASAGGPGAALHRREVRRIFMELSGRLGRRQRAAFILREIEGMATAEVAAILGTTESTVRNHILQARRILQEGLRSRYPEYIPKTKA
jgi:RNA polymerase sigma-70 factor, ECF subfamily